MTTRPVALTCILALGALSCAQLAASNKKAPLPALPEKVLFEIDLTTGNAGPGQATGGSWEGGWRVAAKDDRIVFDAGHPIANGYLEASFTMNRAPHGASSQKLQWIGLHEDASLSQSAHAGDIFYARAGDPKYKWSRLKAGGKKFDDTEWENSVGDPGDWVTDDKTVQTVKLEWRGGQAIFHDSKGRSHACSKKICGGRFPIDRLRYAFLGGDKYGDGSLIGIRFTKVKLVEYDVPHKPAE